MTSTCFDHENLIACQRSIQFVTWASHAAKALPVALKMSIFKP